MKILVHVLLGGLAVFVASRILPGVSVDGFGTAVVVSVVLAAALVPGFHVAGFGWALAFALTLSVLNAFLHGLEKR